MLAVGLTGGIASGKTRVLQRLAARGCRTLDLDQSAREVTAPGSPALGEIAAVFGSRCCRGRRSRPRRARRARVRGRAGARTAQRHRAPARARAGATLVGRRSRGTACSWSTRRCWSRRARTCASTGWWWCTATPRCSSAGCARATASTSAAARARIEAQMPVASKREFAHFAIDSSGSEADTERATDAVFEQLHQLARLAPARSRRRCRGCSAAWCAARASARADSRPASCCSSLQRTETSSSRRSPPGSIRRRPAAWYEAALPAAPAVDAAALGPALVAWVLAARPPDADFLVSAAASLARLTHVESAQRAAACQLALRASGRGARRASCRPTSRCAARAHARCRVALGRARPGFRTRADPGGRASAPRAAGAGARGGGAARGLRRAGRGARRLRDRSVG